MSTVIEVTSVDTMKTIFEPLKASVDTDNIAYVTQYHGRSMGVQAEIHLKVGGVLYVNENVETINKRWRGESTDSGKTMISE